MHTSWEGAGHLCQVYSIFRILVGTELEAKPKPVLELQLVVSFHQTLLKADEWLLRPW